MERPGKNERGEYQLVTDLTDDEYDRLFPHGTRTPQQMRRRLHHIITTGLNNMHRFPGDEEQEAFVASGGPVFERGSFDFTLGGMPLHIHADVPPIKRYAPLWRVYLDDGRVVDVVVSEDIAPTVFIEYNDPWLSIKRGDPLGASKIMTLIPFEIVSLVQNLSEDDQ